MVKDGLESVYNTLHVILTQAFSLLGDRLWDGGMVGVELYVRMASLALKQKEYEMVRT